MTPTLAAYGIGLNFDPPPDEPGKRYILVGEDIPLDHVAATKLAFDTVDKLRAKGCMDPIEIWVMSDTLRKVVQEVRK